MKKEVLILSVIALLLGFSACKTKNRTTTNTTTSTMADNAETSLDWNGTYSGVLPCADCAGIQTKIILKKDNSFVKEVKYLGVGDGEIIRTEGKFKWNKQGNTVTLQDGSEASQYFVAENKIKALDINGNEVTGELADKYVLAKVNMDLVEKYWKLVELNGKPVDTSKQAKEPHMTLRIDGNRVSGNGGCNGFFGTYEVKDGNRIKFSKMGSTMMACPDMSIESEFLRVLEIADNYNLNGDKLVLNRARMAPLARFEVVYMQ